MDCESFEELVSCALDDLHGDAVLGVIQSLHEHAVTTITDILEASDVQFCHMNLPVGATLRLKRFAVAHVASPPKHISTEGQTKACSAGARVYLGPVRGWTVLTFLFVYMLHIASRMASVGYNSPTNTTLLSGDQLSRGASHGHGSTQGNNRTHEASQRQLAATNKELADTRNMSSVALKLTIENEHAPSSTGAGDPPMVYIDLTVTRVQYDHTHGIATLDTWFTLLWADERLKFNGTFEFGAGWSTELDRILLSPEQVWKPDVTPFHLSGIECVGDETQQHTQLIQLYDEAHLLAEGWNAYWSRACSIAIHCDPYGTHHRKLKDFPFDQQQCQIVFGQWSSNSRVYRLGIHERPEKWYESLQSEEWAITRGNAYADQLNYKASSADASSYFQVIYGMTFSRHPHYYIFNVVLPLIILVDAGLLTLWLPRTSDRISVSCTLLLTVMATMSFTSAMRPASNEETWLDRFQSRCLALAFLPVLLAAGLHWLEFRFRQIKDLPHKNARLVDSDSLNLKSEIQHDDPVFGYFSTLAYILEAERIDNFSKALIKRIPWSNLSLLGLTRAFQIFMIAVITISHFEFLWPHADELLKYRSSTIVFVIASALLLLNSAWCIACLAFYGYRAVAKTPQASPKNYLAPDQNLTPSCSTQPSTDNASVLDQSISDGHSIREASKEKRDVMPTSGLADELQLQAFPYMEETTVTGFQRCDLLSLTIEPHIRQFDASFPDRVAAKQYGR